MSLADKRPIFADGRTHATPDLQGDGRLPAHFLGGGLSFDRVEAYLIVANSRKSDGLRRFAAPSSFFVASHSTGGPIGGPPQKEIIKMITGTVKFFNPDKGFGFIQPEDGSSDAFVHISAVEAAGMRTLDRDQRVTYDLENDRRGRTSAVNLKAA